MQHHLWALNIKKNILKSFEPLGIFSNDLEEFLTLQLKSQNLLDSDLKLILKNLTILANENIFSIAKKLKIDIEKLKDSLDMLKRCSPAPIDTDSDLISHINSPDIIVEKDKNEWIVSLNEETLPKVIVLTGYWEELSRKKLSKEDLEEKLKEFQSSLKDLKMKHSISPIENPLEIKKIRRTIARLKTFESDQ